MMRLLGAALLLLAALLPPIASLAQFGVPGDFAIPFTVVATPTTWNPADKGARITLSGGNLTLTGDASGTWNTVRTVASESSGKWYIEVTLGAGGNWDSGVCDSTATLANFTGFDSHGYGENPASGTIFNAGGSAGTDGTGTTADVMGIAVDIGGALAWWRVNAGNWNNSALNNPATGVGGIALTGVSTPMFICGSGVSSGAETANFGGTAMSFAVPVGFTTGFH